MNEFDNSVYDNERLVSKYDKMQAATNEVKEYPKDEEDLVYRLRRRAEIRRQIKDRKSVQEGKPDRIADILEEAATEIETLRNELNDIRDDSVGV